MPFDWWSRLPPWAQWILSLIPSPVVEFFSGLFADALAWGIIAVVLAVGAPLTRTEEQLLTPADRVAQVAAIALLAHLFSALYEAFIDKRGWEWKDILQREVGIIAGLVFVWWWLRAHAH